MNYLLRCKNQAISHKKTSFWPFEKNPKIWRLDLSSHKTTVVRSLEAPLNGAQALQFSPPANSALPDQGQLPLVMAVSGKAGPLHLAFSTHLHDLLDSCSHFLNNIYF